MKQGCGNLPNYIQQPGPDGTPYTSTPTRLIEMSFEISAGETLHVSLTQEINAHGLKGGGISGSLMQTCRICIMSSLTFQKMTPCRVV